MEFYLGEVRHRQCCPCSGFGIYGRILRNACPTPYDRKK